MTENSKNLLVEKSREIDKKSYRMTEIAEKIEEMTENNGKYWNIPDNQHLRNRKMHKNSKHPEKQ